ncbi:MAG: YIP1 family protein [candidate division KSB1 bacterium]|nr:YIP1 family protein [candidate division KSB1 bacterium]
MDTLGVDVDRRVSEMGLGGRLYNFFFGSPSKAAAALQLRARWTDWLIPVLVTFVVTAFAGKLTQDIVYNEMRQRLQSSTKLTEEQVKVALDRMEQQREKWTSPGRQAVAYALSFAVILAITAIVGGVVLFITNVILGGEVKYVQGLSLAAWGSWLVHMTSAGSTTLVGLFPGIVKVPLILAKGSTDVTTSLALLWPGSKAAFLYHLLSKVDVFNIWLLAVMTAGIATLARANIRKTAYWVVGLWSILAVLSALVTSLLMKLQGIS